METEKDGGKGEKLGYVLSGGGGRGAFEAGVLYRLSREKEFAEPDVVAGTSAGAINAALFASGKTPEFIRDFWFELGAARPARTNDSFFTDSLLSFLPLVRSYFKPALGTLRAVLTGAGEHHGLGSGLSNLVDVLLTERFDSARAFLAAVRATHLVDTIKLRARLCDAFGGEVIHSERCALAINAVDACTNRVVRFVNRVTPRTVDPEYVVVPQITVDMVLASTSIPILFPSIPLDRRLLWDGGVLSNTPLAPAVALGAERILTVLVAHDSPFEDPRFANLGHALERLVDMLLENAYNVDRSLLLTRNKLAGMEHRHSPDGSRYRRVRLYEAIRPPRDAAFDVASLLDFSRPLMQHFHALGEDAAAAWLRRGPREDAGNPNGPVALQKQPAPELMTN
jgi:NTE family protein